MDLDCSASTMKTSGIEHHLYSIEKWKQGKRSEEKLIICTPQDATLYALDGYTVFDFHMSLDMEPEYYSEAIQHEL